MHRRKQYGHGFGEACSCTIDEEVAPTADVEECVLLPLIVEARVGVGFAEVALHEIRTPNHHVLPWTLATA
jgi:hypothetical protein